ncbi:hypothetical protein DDZ13_08490 [Coraliomargarita sinensis]|uniref:(2Fe-2S) ferredoxin domain-containing protein n=1 Tax=Coraliomargarita sinensis TaxID=2174842 RepID=A0A317ZJJ1_9BACT|nr:(2Fe-2S) ferredoxin domain-containing protein [Coraliomargarita sinensis]PXA04068.1 hypothetical protein DDZ13_08490 [Coraliomargarita sinensis]
MSVLYICKECKKPKSKDVRGKALKGKKLFKALQSEELSFEVKTCKCLGKCKQGPNGIIVPGKQRYHRLSVKKLRQISRDIG